MNRVSCLSGCFLAGLATLLTGCGDQYAGRYAISGKVTVKGEKLKDGQIIFVPLDKSVGTESGAPIKDGEYEIKRMNGLKPGKYLVRITHGDGKTPPNMEEAGNPGGSTNIVSFDLIPPEFGIRSTQEVEVKDSGKNEFNFEIPKFMTPPVQRKR
jgi:uncharacterized protein (DUF2141 family)